MPNHFLQYPVHTYNFNLPFIQFSNNSQLSYYYNIDLCYKYNLIFGLSVRRQVAFQLTNHDLVSSKSFKRKATMQ